MAASELWLLGLWLNCYRAWDRAGKLTRGALFCGAGLLLCVLATPWLTELIIVSYIARISQYLYGGCMLLSAAFSWLMFRCLNRANGGDADGARANAAHRKALLGAMGILAAGIVLCAVRFRQAVWYSVVVAGVWLLVTAAIQAREA